MNKPQMTLLLYTSGVTTPLSASARFKSRQYGRPRLRSNTAHGRARTRQTTPHMRKSVRTARSTGDVMLVIIPPVRGAQFLTFLLTQHFLVILFYNKIKKFPHPHQKIVHNQQSTTQLLALPLTAVAPSPRILLLPNASSTWL
jgi:hypothetical protein